MKTSAFTLLEVLVVVSIIGILIAIGIPNYFTYQRRLNMQQSVQQFARDIDAARNEAKRTNACRTVAYVDSSSYKIQSFTTPNCTGTPTDQVIRLVQGTTLTPLINGTGTGAAIVTSMDFRPPYGINTGTPAVFKIASATDTTVFNTLRLTAVMGKVIIK